MDMIMPQMGESIVEGTIIKWRKQPGEPVQKDEIILEISTDKVDSEIPAPADGILAEILVEEGQTVAVGTPIARISKKDDKQGKSEPTPQREQPPETKPEPAIKTPAIELDSKRFLSPVVKKIAREHGLGAAQLDAIVGSGINGRITKSDILAVVEGKSRPDFKSPMPTEIPQPSLPEPIMASSDSAAAEASYEDHEIIAMDHVRKRIAEHMLLSKRTSAHVTSVAEVDLTPIVQYRESVKKMFEQREGFPLTYTVFFIDAAARALKEFPLINASVDKDRIILKRQINIGIAVGMDRGLIVPVVRNADQMNLTGIARTVADLANRARNKELNPEEVQGGTFSITNIGTFGNLFGTPIINQPQLAILGTGVIKKRPVVINDAIAIRSMMFISLTYDHRIIDGLYAGRFLQRLVQMLEGYSFP
ncbi:2-oxo acid dehydrogenase subunit E2 [candidate division KSB1 bacterium]|nr:2-oxo acid dehydrogenase subunit E2 [candidate division KSB1 bacterium]